MSLALFPPATLAPVARVQSVAPAEVEGGIDAAAQRLRAPSLAPELVHPALWFGHQLGRGRGDVRSSGFPPLDAALPGGGWPQRALSELLLPHPGIGEIRLLAPSLAATQRSERLVMLFDPPAQLSAWALTQLGLDVDQLLIVQSRARVVPGSDSLWAFEQALKSGHVGALLAWLPPRLRADRLRRLQLAAHSHDGIAFVFREAAAAQRPSAAPLRLALRAAGPDRLALRVLKRRGPPLETAIHLALPPVVSELGLQRSRVEIARELPAATFVDLG
jgi:protein ImuA